MVGFGVEIVKNNSPQSAVPEQDEVDCVLCHLLPLQLALSEF